MQKKRTMFIIALSIMALVAGCGKKSEQSSEIYPRATEAQAVQNDIPIQQKLQETEPLTETETELQETDAPEKTIEELLSIFKDRGRTGKMQYEIITSEGTQKGEAVYNTNEGVFELCEEGQGVAYAYDDASYVQSKDAGWREGNVVFRDLFNVAREGNGAVIGEVSNDASTRTYKITLSDTTQVTGEAVLPVNIWYEDLTVTKSAAIYYLDDAGNLKRIDVSVAFTGLGDAAYVEGKYNAVFSVDNFYDDGPSVPESVLEEIYPDYTPGDLTEALYQNEMFDLKIAGKDFITFDMIQTSGMKDSYKVSRSGYEAEAVGNCEEGIISIASAKYNSALPLADALQKYLNNCGAKEIGAGEIVEFNGKEATRCPAKINDTSTYTYCLTSGSRVLFITIYFKDEATVNNIMDCVYRMWEDPNWVEMSWVLEGNYTIRTPKNYKIVEADSSDIYLCMEKGGTEVNVFVLTATTVDAQVESDIGSTEDSISELVLQEDIAVNDGVARYAVICERSGETNYYTYELLQQAGEDVLKYFVVSLDGNEDYREELTSIAATMTLPAVQSEETEGTTDAAVKSEVIG